MFNLEFNLQELHELHTTLFVRKCQLQTQLTHQNKDVASIAMRQLERVSPMLYYVESVVREHDINKQAKKESETRVEDYVERQMNRLDKKLMQGHISQNEYDKQVSELNDWAESSLAC